MQRTGKPVAGDGANECAADGGLTAETYTDEGLLPLASSMDSPSNLLDDVGPRTTVLVTPHEGGLVRYSARNTLIARFRPPLRVDSRSTNPFRSPSPRMR